VRLSSLSNAEAVERRAPFLKEEGPFPRAMEFPSYGHEAYLADVARGLFPEIDLSHPGLQLVHERPYIFLIHDFLSPTECDDLIAKASAGLQRQTFDNRGTSNGKRTSEGVICENEEIPGFQRKVLRLTRVAAPQLQHLKISRYREGEEFTLHSDAMVPSTEAFKNTADLFADITQRAQGNWNTCNVPGENRFMTVFVYLNTCARGGCTSFPRMGAHYGLDGACFYAAPGPFNSMHAADGSSYTEESEQLVCEAPLRIAPRRGLAVLHFPSLTPQHGGTVDANAMHCSEPAIDEKFICQQFIYSSSKWQTPKSNQPSGCLSVGIC